MAFCESVVRFSESHHRLGVHLSKCSADLFTWKLPQKSVYDDDQILPLDVFEVINLCFHRPAEGDKFDFLQRSGNYLQLKSQPAFGEWAKADTSLQAVTAGMHQAAKRFLPAWSTALSSTLAFHELTAKVFLLKQL